MADTSNGARARALPLKSTSKWLLAGAVLSAAVLLAASPPTEAAAAANAGVSEVWSETEGLRLKYSTNHGNLLSNKGSEMSLSSDQKHLVEPAGEEGAAAVAAAAAGTGGDESAAASAESGNESSGGPAQGAESEESSGEQQAEGGGGGHSEQGAADSRKTEKVVPSTAGRVHSYSSLAGQSPSRAHQYKSSASSRSEAPSSSAYDFSGSAPEDQMVNDNGEASASGNGEQSSADTADSTEGPLASEAPAGVSKFRAPGKHFKEAIKMGSQQQQQQKQTSAVSEDSSSEDSSAGAAGDKGEEQNAAAEESPAPRASPKVAQAAADETEDGADFNEGGGSWGAALNRQASAKRAQAQEEADYGRPYPETASLDSAEGPSAFAGGLEQPEQLFRSATPRAQMNGGFQFPSEEQSLGNFNAPPAAGPMFYEGSAQSSRALLASGSHKERSQPSPVGTSGARRQPASSAAAAPGPANKQAYKQLAYFKSVADQPASRYTPTRNAAAADASPDSVRDNFISPGHYPGSMPHLTQAASEIAQAKEEASKSASQTNAESGQQQPPVIASDTNHSQATTESQRAAESKEAPVAVTPTPAAQPESQQIMAPILVSTTTMAPLVPTPASTSPAPSATSQTPALKRFKFRKYR